MDLTEVIIEKDVPLPAAKNTKHGLGATLRKLDVGDSFAVPRFSIPNISTQVCVEGRRTGRKYITRTCGGNGQPELTRIWRTA